MSIFYMFEISMSDQSLFDVKYAYILDWKSIVKYFDVLYLNVKYIDSNNLIII